MFVYDREAKSFDILGPIVTDDGYPLYRTHDLAVFDDGTLYVAETDVPKRSGYLWECKIEY